MVAITVAAMTVEAVDVAVQAVDPVVVVAEAAEEEVEINGI